MYALSTHAPCTRHATTAHLRQCAERPDALLTFSQAGGGQHALHAAAPVQAHRTRADAPLPVAVRLLSSAAAALEAASSDQHVRALRSSGCCTLLIDITLREVEREPEILEEVHALCAGVQAQFARAPSWLSWFRLPLL